VGEAPGSMDQSGAAGRGADARPGYHLDAAADVDDRAGHDPDAAADTDDGAGYHPNTAADADDGAAVSDHVWEIAETYLTEKQFAAIIGWPQFIID
jgi:hypothetical protein